MNLNQEIKLGDLFKNAKKKSKNTSRANKRANDRRPKKLDVVGLKIGASQLAAAHVVNNGSAKLVRWYPISSSAVLASRSMNTVSG